MILNFINVISIFFYNYVYAIFILWVRDIREH